MPELLIVRHAQSEWNAVGRWQGQADPPLSPEGRIQAHQAAAHLARLAGDALRFTHVASSDLRRATETAEILRADLGLDGPIVESRDLRERDMGSWSGLTRIQIEAGWPGGVEALRNGLVAGPPGGETTVAVRERALRAVTVLGGSEDTDGQSLVVAHGGLIRALLETLGATPRPVGHCSGVWLTAESGGLSPGPWLELLNEKTEPAQQAV